jgi:hypothetical protein
MQMVVFVQMDEQVVVVVVVVVVVMMMVRLVKSMIE